MVASTSIADEAAALDLVEQYRRMHGKAARDNRNVLFRVTSAAVQHITPEARKGIQKRWVSSFMSNKYKYLNEVMFWGAGCVARCTVPVWPEFRLLVRMGYHHDR